MTECELRALVGANVRALRKRRGMTQVALAERLGLSRPGVSYLETGQCVSLWNTVQAAQLFGVSLDELTKAVEHET